MRVSDVESALIPRIYFDYARGRRRERIIPVRDHHAQDICSLAALAGLLAHAVVEPDDPIFSHAAVQWGLAQLFSRADDHASALARIRKAMESAGDDEVEFRLAMHLARRLKRLGRVEEAVQLWIDRAAPARADHWEPIIELAKHAEHQTKDLINALRYTEQAVELLRAGTALGAPSEESSGCSFSRASGNGALMSDLNHRWDRLRRKLAGLAR
jgi:tetratricopeptide (TPR) repeat protein